MKRLLILSVLCAGCSSTLFGQNPPRELGATVKSLLGDWESIKNDGRISLGMPMKSFRTLTFTGSGDGSLHLTKALVDINQVLPGTKVRMGALVEEYELYYKEPGVFQYRETNRAYWRFGEAKLDDGLTKRQLKLIPLEGGALQLLQLGDYLQLCWATEAYNLYPEGRSCDIFRRGAKGTAELLAISAGLKKNTPHDPHTAAYFASVESAIAEGNVAFWQRTGVDTLEENRRHAQLFNDSMANPATPPKSAWESASDMAGAVAAGLNQAQQQETARQQAAAERQVEIARQQAAAQRQAEITRQQAQQAEIARQQRTSGAGGSAVNPGVLRCAGPGCFWDGTRCRSELGGATCTVGGSAPAPASQSSTLPGSLSNGSATTTAVAQQQAEIARQQRAQSVPESDKVAPSLCLVFGTKASNGILENRCAFPIDVTFCNEKGSNAFRCDANQYGNFTIGANDEQTTGYSTSNGRLYYVACRSPYSASGADRRWDGTSIVAACK